MLDLTITFVLLQVIIKHLLGLVYLGKEITFQASFDYARLGEARFAGLGSDSLDRLR